MKCRFLSWNLKGQKGHKEPVCVLRIIILYIYRKGVCVLLSQQAVCSAIWSDTEEGRPLLSLSLPLLPPRSVCFISRPLWTNACVKGAWEKHERRRSINIYLLYLLCVFYVHMYLCMYVQYVCLHGRTGEPTYQRENERWAGGKSQRLKEAEKRKTKKRGKDKPIWKMFTRDSQKQNIIYYCCTHT